MIKNALKLWKSEQKNKGSTLQHRLILFFACVTVFFILTFTLLLTLFGINGKEEKTAHQYFSTELEHISQLIYNDFGRISLDGISLAQTISDSCDTFFKQHNIAPAELAENPKLLEPLLKEQMQSLLGVLKGRSCGGTFILLDATISNAVENTHMLKSGIFLKKTQPTLAQSVGIKNYYLRGPAQIARDYGIELLGQWKMEYDITGEDFFTEVMATARENPQLPLSRLYYWTGRTTLKDNSEAGFLLCVPLRSSDGFVFGICGIEVSDRMFKQLYCPSIDTYENVFAVAAPTNEVNLATSKGMIAGNYYLTGNRMSEDLSYSKTDKMFEHFISSNTSYGGQSTTLKLYPIDSPFETERWSVAVLMPQQQLSEAIKGNYGYFLLIVCVLIVISLWASVLISRRYLSPVSKALASIHSNSLENESEYSEIADLFEFLAQKDKDHENRQRLLEQQRREAQESASIAQTELSRLADKKQKEVDHAQYKHFLSQLSRLTPRENAVFELYLEGKTAKEIIALLGFLDNALKYHNRNIYEKLGVSSRKELLMYAVLMKQEKMKQK